MSDSWIMTYSGTKFWPLNPKPASIKIEDIAHHLSNICRYTGACKYHFSVAQHSVLVSYESKEQGWGLLHDAAEAYLSDIATPVKEQLLGIEQIEEKILKAVAGRFGLQWPMPDEVKRADASVTAAEWRIVMGSIDMTRFAKVKPAQVSIVQMIPEQAEQLFLVRFEELTDGQFEATQRWF